jgi:hypothetical protein
MEFNPTTMNNESIEQICNLAKIQIQHAVDKQFIYGAMFGAVIATTIILIYYYKFYKTQK